MPPFKLISLSNKKQIILLSVLFILIIFTGSYIFFLNETKSIRVKKHKELEGIAYLKIKQISEWFNDQYKDANLIAEGNLRVKKIEEWLGTGSEESKIELTKNLEFQIKLKDYHSIYLIDTNGNILLAVGSHISKLDTLLKTKIRECIITKSAITTFIYKCKLHSEIQIDFFAPVYNSNKKLMAIIMLRIDPNEFLYPLIQLWPFDSKTSETIILKKDGDSILYLNNIRFLKNSALNFKLPLTRTDLPAVQAANGYKGLFDGIDYRGERVLAWLNNIPGTPWFMVAKIDKKELFKDIYFELMLVIGISIIFIAFVLLALSLIYNSRQKNIFRELWRTQEEFRITLFSIGDGVITTDRKGKIKYLNSVAENLTGWTENEALGKDIEKVFHIINEETREKVVNPVAKVLEQGLVVGLANHTLLISKHEKETPIADSGAPIKDENGNVVGVVLVFRDQTEEREQQKLLEIRLNLFEYAAKHNLEQLLTKTLDEICGLTRSKIGFYHFLNEDQETLTLQEWSSKTKLEFCKAEGKGLHYHISDAGVWVDCVRERKPIIHNDYKTLPHRKGLPEGHAEVVRELVVPVSRVDKIVAILGIGNKESDYTEKDVELVTYLADIAWEITEKKKLEESIHESEERSRLILENSMDAILFTDPVSGDILTANKAACEIFQMSEKEICDRGREGLIDLNDKRLEILLEQRKRNGMARGEINMIRKDNSVFPVEVSSSVFLNSDGNLRAGLIIRDISERKKAEEKIKQNELLYRSLFENMLNGFAYHRMIYDNGKPVDYTYLLTNEAFEKQTGLKDVTGKNISEVIPGLLQSDPELFEIYGRVATTGVPEVFETFVESMKMWFSISVYCPQKGYFITVFDDITERKNAEKVLSESEEKFRRVFEHASVGKSLTYVSGNMIVNKAFSNITGYSAEELNKLKWFEITHPEDIEQDRKFIETLLSGQFTEMRWEKRYIHKNGNVVWVDLSTCLQHDHDGNPLFFITTIQDITQQKQMIVQLKESEQKFSAAFNNSPVAMSMVYVDSGHIIDVNEKYLSVSGLKKSDIIGKKLSEIKLFKDTENTMNKIREHTNKVLNSGLSNSLIFKSEMYDEVLKTFSLTTCLIMLNGKNVFLSSLMDITKEQELLDKLKESEEKFFKSFHHSPVSMTLSKVSDGKFVDCNNNFLELMRYSREEVIGHTTESLGIYANIDDRNKIVEEIKKNGSVYGIPVKGRKKDKTEIDTLLSSTLINIGNISYFLSTIIDVTEVKQAEDEIRKLNRIYAVLSNVNQAIVRNHKKELLFNELCRIAVEDGKLKFSWIGLLNKQTNLIEIVASSGFTEDYFAHVATDMSKTVNMNGPAGVCLKTGKYFVSNDVENDLTYKSWRKDVQKLDYHSFAAFPIIVYNEIIGVICFYSDETGFFKDSEIELLDELQHDVSFALEFIENEEKRILSENQLKEKLDELQRWHTATLGREERVIELKKK